MTGMKRTLLVLLSFVFFSEVAVARTVRVDATDFIASATSRVSASDVLTAIFSYDPNDPFSVMGDRRSFALSSISLGLNAVPVATSFLEGMIFIKDSPVGSRDPRDIFSVSITGLERFDRLSFSAVSLEPTGFSSFVPTAAELNALEFNELRFLSSRVSAETVAFSEVPTVPLAPSGLLLMGAIGMLALRRKMYSRS
ncbi:MAG: hypothetical protein AAGF55_17470 [Pseudomonadota bacterium]